MGMKNNYRPVSTLFSLLLAFFIMAAPVRVFASFEFSPEQAQLVMPYVTVYFNASVSGAEWPDTDVQASLDGVALETLDSGFTSDSENDILYIFIADCSTSITVPQMNAMKTSLLNFLSNKRDNERVMLISIGESVEVLLEGGESADKATAIIEGLERNQDSTALFDALNRAVTLSESLPDLTPTRRAAVLFTDSEEFTVGGYTYDELLAGINGESIPIYAIGFNTGTAEALGNLGTLARSSGGELLVTAYDKIEENASSVIEKIRSSRKISFSAPTNEASGKPGRLVMRFMINGEAVTKEMDVVPRRWIPDALPPSIKNIELPSANTLKIYFTEPVYGAETPENFLIGLGSEYHTVMQSAYLPLENAAVLTMENPLDFVDYTVACLNITDCSMEANPLSDGYLLELSREAPETPANPNITVLHETLNPSKYAWVPAVTFLVLAAIVTAIIITVTLRKKQSNGIAQAQVYTPPAAPPVSPMPLPAEPKHRFSAVSAVPLRMHVTDQGGVPHKVELKVSGSIFVGSSDISNLRFDDGLMAPQHFAVEAKDGLLFIHDLGTSGGTSVNGVRLNSPRRLNSGDSISAGQVTFRIL